MSYISYYSFSLFWRYNIIAGKNVKGQPKMKKEQYEHIENTLRELSLYIRACRIEDERENFKRQFHVVLKDTVAPMRSAEDSQPNKEKRKKSRLVFSKKELQDMPYLKDLKYRKTSQGYHQFRYRRDGFNLSFNSKHFETAKKKAYDFIKDLNNTIRKQSDAVHGKTFGYIAELWLDLKRKHVVPDSFRTYVGVYYNHIAPTFAQRSVKSILPMDLQPYFDDLFSRQERTCEDAKIIFRGVFDYAVANRLIPSNPMDGVIVNKHFRKTGTILTDEQIERFKIKMLDSGYFGTAGLIILYTGVRGHELHSIVFDWNNGTLTVNNAKLKKGQRVNEDNLKRTIPIFPALWKYRDRIEKDDSWKIKPTTLSCKWKTHWNENTVKDLRHTFTTKAQIAGVEEALVNLWTGHLPGKTVTANVYTHFPMDYQIKQAEKITNY